MKITKKQIVIIAIIEIIVMTGIFFTGFKIGQSAPDFPENVVCDNGEEPDKNGCCAGEEYTDMGAMGFNCCPPDGKDCFLPIK